MHADAVETARMAIYLNAALGGHRIDKFWGHGARFVSAVEGHIAAADPQRWLAAQQHCRGFRTQMRRPDKALLPLWFSAHWVLKVLAPDTEQTWRAYYEVKAEPGSTRKLWLVTYRPASDGHDVTFRGRDLGKVADDMTSVLKRLIAITGSRIPAWQDTFVRLLSDLQAVESAQMEPVVPRDVLGDLPTRVVKTALAANVFNGMGNWADNIYGADVQPAVEELTASLFDLLAEGLEGAVDSTLPKKR